MAKRHTIRPGDLESIFGRLQELVLANSGEDEFEEIFKLLVAKLFAEHQLDRGLEFRAHPSASETARNINSLLRHASDRWQGILVGEPTSSLTNEHLSVCVEALQGHSLLDSNLEVLDGAFEYLVNRAAKGSKGQFFTPRHVIDCCVQMVNPSLTETVLDPACGSGGFLIHTLNHVRARSVPLDYSEYCRSHLWGFDFDQRAIRVAKALMLIAGDGHANMVRLNSLLTQSGTISLFQSDLAGEMDSQLTIEDIARSRFRNFKGFDIILTNPPFAGEVREPHILRSYDVHRQGRRIERDVLFLERSVNLLRPGGRLAIVLPHNKFAGEKWSYLREWLLRRLRVVAVLGLGRNTFLPHTHQKTSVLFGIKREQPVSRAVPEDILFLLSDKDGKDTKGQIIPRLETVPEDPAWVRADHDFGEIVAVFRDFVVDQKISWGI